LTTKRIVLSEQRLLRLTLWLVTNRSSIALSEEQYVLPDQHCTWLVDGSSVLQATVAEADVMSEALISAIVGGVVSLLPQPVEARMREKHNKRREWKGHVTTWPSSRWIA